MLYGARQGPDRNLSNATRTLDYTSDRDGNGIDGRNPPITSTSAWEGNKQGKPWELCGALECQVVFFSVLGVNVPLFAFFREEYRKMLKVKHSAIEHSRLLSVVINEANRGPRDQQQNCRATQTVQSEVDKYFCKNVERSVFWHFSRFRTEMSVSRNASTLTRNFLHSHPRRTFSNSFNFQADFIYDEQAANLDKYEPRHASVLLLLSFFVVIQVIFTAVHAFALPPIPSRLPNSTSHPSTHESTADRKVTGCAQSEQNFSPNFSRSALLFCRRQEIRFAIY